MSADRRRRECSDFARVTGLPGAGVRLKVFDNGTSNPTIEHFEVDVK
jgi:hypothetical protein